MPSSIPEPSPATAGNPQLHPVLAVLLKALAWLVGAAIAGMIGVMCLVALVMAIAYPNLPEVADLAAYRPKLPLRVFSIEGDLMGEFGEEHRTFTPITEIPQVMKDAIITDCP